MFFGKLFCSYICPIGTVIEWLNKIGDKLKISFTLKGILDRVLRLGKYVLLFFTAYFTITSSELWCKKFDPYFGLVSRFDHDTVLWMVLLSLFIVLIVSVIIKFFWCKYVCPLSALSNIFANFIITIPIIIIYLIIRWIGIDLNILWLILALTASGAITEIFRFKFFSISPFKIKLDKNYCTSCKICDNNCPQGIEVHKYETVDHPDCNLCMECVNSCRVDKSIKLGNFKSAYITPIVIVALVILAFIFSKNFEFSTLSERWGGYDSLTTVSQLKMEDMKSVKCWGTANSLANKLMRKKGIVGLDAWASAHKIKIHYNTDVITEKGVKEAIFNPEKFKLRLAKKDNIPEKFSVLKIGIDGLFDTYDNYDLIRMLRKNKAIYGLSTNFGEPVIAQIVFIPEKMTSSEIIEIIEKDSYIKKTKDGEQEVEVEFECEGDGKIIREINYNTFVREYFSGFDMKFNKYESYTEGDLQIFEIGFPMAERLKSKLQYLTSHISFFDGTVRVKTVFTDKPVLQVYFDPSQVTKKEI
ncbi:MAG: 4Fe-4S binding protein, partial [Patescibacteria group bacterium]|nr:4Fe-4S binding protein [Patescibacteria group bacterium]